MDQIILSTNEDPLYMDFWKPVSKAYKKIFPDITIHLAFLTDKEEDHPLVKEFREYGEVTLFRPEEDVPEFGQAKMIRFLLASQQDNDVCYVDDIDLFPLEREFITDKVKQRPKDHLLCVGGEVYHNKGTYPVSQMTAEGYLWKQFINPDEKSFRELLWEWAKDPVFDAREVITLEVDWAKDQYFSDERLIRRLLKDHPVPIFELERGYSNVLEATLDRMQWEINMDKLGDGGYVNAHMIRPYKGNEELIQPLIDYVENKF